MEGGNEKRPQRALWGAAVLLPVLCCAALPLFAAAGASAGIALLGVGVMLGALVLGAALVGLVLALRRRRAQACRLPVQRTEEPV